MALSSDLISQFVKTTKDDKEVRKETTVYGTIVFDDRTYVHLDGAPDGVLTPVSATADVKNGDRVTVMIKDHTATVTGNITEPSASSVDVGNLTGQVGNLSNKATEFDVVIAHKVTADDIQATNGMFSNITARTGKYSELESITAEFEDLKASFIEGKTLKVEDIEAITANIESIKAKFGGFTEIETDDLEAINAEITNLKGYTADFTYISAVKIGVKDLEADKLSAKDAELKYVNINMANIDKAWMEEFYAKSGLINYVVTEDLTSTGYLVGVTIKGDLIEGGTIVADKLVVKDSKDGLYYKLNISGESVEAEQTEYNSLNGSIITAKSITAEKLHVTDLVAFGATIGGFKIASNAIHSLAKSDVRAGTRGIYLDNDGQFSLGDATNYLRFFNDTIYRQVVWDSEAGKYIIPENAVEFDFDYMIQGPFPNEPDTDHADPPPIDEGPKWFTDEGYPVYLAEYDDPNNVYDSWIDFCAIPNYKLEIAAESILFGANSRKSAADLKALTDYVKIKTIVDEETGDEKPCIELSEEDDKRNRRQTITNIKNTFTEEVVKTEVGIDGIKTTSTEEVVKTEVGIDGIKTTDFSASGSITHNNLTWAFRANGNCGLSWKEATN